MTRARSAAAEGGLDARAEPPPSLSSLLRQALQGAVFPLSAERLSLVARENAAPTEVLTLLGALPRREFRSLEAVEFSLEADAQDRACVSQESPRAPGVRGT